MFGRISILLYLVLVCVSPCIATPKASTAGHILPRTGSTTRWTGAYNETGGDFSSIATNRPASIYSVCTQYPIDDTTYILNFCRAFPETAALTSTTFYRVLLNAYDHVATNLRDGRGDRRMTQKEYIFALPSSNGQIYLENQTREGVRILSFWVFGKILNQLGNAAADYERWSCDFTSEDSQRDQTTRLVGQGYVSAVASRALNFKATF